MLQSPLNVPKAKWRDDTELDMFSDAVRMFMEKECKPHVEDWREAGVVPRDMWTKGRRDGLAGAICPEEYGGVGGDFRHDAIIIEQLEWQALADLALACTMRLLRLTSLPTAPKSKSSV